MSLDVTRMKIKILVVLLVCTLVAYPGVSHGFALLRWAFDAVANQFGLDRGPIPKVMPKEIPPNAYPPGQPRGKTDRYPGFFIQADGF